MINPNIKIKHIKRIVTDNTVTCLKILKDGKLAATWSNGKIAIYTFNFIPILKLKVTNKKINKALSNEKIRKAINEQKTKIIENRKDIDIETIKEIKNIKMEIDEMNLIISLGTEDAAITALIIPIISTFIAIFLSQKVEKYNDKCCTKKCK